MNKNPDPTSGWQEHRPQEQMPKKDSHQVLGTWRLTVTLSSGSGRVIISFTSDGTMLEVFGDLPETGLGVWEPVDTGGNDFRYTSETFVHDLSGNLSRITRVRSTNHFTDANRFEGTFTVDIFDPATEAIIRTFHGTQVATRMLVIP